MDYACDAGFQRLLTAILENVKLSLIHMQETIIIAVQSSILRTYIQAVTLTGALEIQNKLQFI